MMNVGYAVENTSTHSISYYITDTYDWQEVRGTIKMSINEIPNTEGEYIIYPVARFVDGNWIKFNYSDQWQSYICLSVKNGKASLYNPEIDYPIESGKVAIDSLYYILDDDDNTACVTFKNRRYASYCNSVKIPQTINYNNKCYTVNTIGEQAFQSSINVTSVEIPNTVEFINRCAFDFRGNNPVKISLGSDSKLKVIEECAFSGAFIDNFQFPNGIETIESYAFTYHRMSKIVIPKSVKQLGYRAFTTYGQTQKEDIYVEWTTQKELSEINWYAFDETHTTPQSRPYKTLFVPRGYKALYESVVPSDMIDKIEEYDLAGISEVDIDDINQQVLIFNLQGIKVFQGNASDIPTLPNGVYLKRVGNKVVKVVI